MNPCNVCKWEGDNKCPFAGTKSSGKLVEGCGQWERETESEPLCPNCEPDVCILKYQVREAMASNKLLREGNESLQKSLKEAHAFAMDWKIEVNVLRNLCSRAKEEIDAKNEEINTLRSSLRCWEKTVAGPEV